MNVSSQYALRSLMRSTTRTLLSLIGVGIGCAIAAVAVAWIKGESGMMAESTAMSGQGYLQVVPRGWQESRDTRLRITGDWKKLRKTIEGVPGITVVTPQVETQGLLGMGTKVQGVSLLGGDPKSEREIRRTIRAVSQGRYLQADDKNALVLGSELAKRLDVSLNDEIVVTAVAPTGEMNSSLLTLVGVVHSGSRSIDATVAHTNLNDAIHLGGRPGVERFAILVNEPKDVGPLAQRVERAIDDSKIKEIAKVDTLTWIQVNPSLVAAKKADAAFSNAIIFVIVLLVILGITSAQLTGVLQRGREFSALLALGMKRRTLWRLIFTEALFTGIAGAVLATVFATPALWYLSQVGVDYGAISGNESGMNMSGILLDPIMKADVGIWVIPFLLVLAIGATLIGAIYPAIYSLRIDPASILRARN
ncbi:MAG: ABC transporter permease [Polyangiaceae bacterium]|nr:ABC transporter permease [Polyangiaceae bacterium]